MKTEESRKKGFYFWLEPDIDKKIDAHLPMTDSRTRSEFVNEAIRRYCCELSSEENKEYLSREIINIIRANIKNAENHIASTIFKLAGEQATLNLIVADQLIGDIDDETIRAYRNAYDIVRKRHGVFNFEDAMEDARSVSESEN